MKTLKEIEENLKKSHEKLQNLKVKSLFVFGSFAKGTNSEGSDIDFLVEFSEPVGFFEFLDLKYFLEELFGKEIDLATRNALHPKLKDGILKEAIRVA